MSPSTYTLFDIPTKAPRVCWSMNTWRGKSVQSNPSLRRLKLHEARLLLNYKGLDYKTEWLEYPDIRVRLNEHVTPNESGAPFTLPAIQLPDGSYVMDSYKIADAIAEKHPEPSLPIHTPEQPRFRKILMGLMTELGPIYVPGVAQRILGDGSLDFFNASRQKDVGMPLEDYAKQNGPGAFERAGPFAREMTALLNETPGPYFSGDIVTYTDFIWAAILLFFKCLGDEEYGQLLKRSGDAETHARLLDTLSAWTERNDH